MNRQFTAAMILSCFFGCGDSAPQQPATSASSASPRHVEKPLEPRLNIGDVGFLSARGQTVMVFPYYSSMDEAETYIEARDDIGLDGMVASRQMLVCESGTQARLIEDGILARRVRILSGPYYGEDGWVTREFVHAKSKLTSNTDSRDAEKPKPLNRKLKTKTGPVVINAETVSAAQLDLAKSLLDRNPSAAKERLEEIVDLFPDTPAGREAAVLLGRK